MQVCTALHAIYLQTDSHASTLPLRFFTGRMPFLPPNQQRQSTEAYTILHLMHTKRRKFIGAACIVCGRDVTELAEICFHRIRMLCFKSVGCRCRFATLSQFVPMNSCLSMSAITKSDDVSRSHLAFNIMQTSRNNYSLCICLLLCGKRLTAISDE